MVRKNQQLAEVLYEIADMLEIQDANRFKVRAYRRAAQRIESLSDDIEDIYKKGKLQEIEGVGSAIAEHIEEFLETGKIKKHGKLKKEVPVRIDELNRVEGLGPKSIKKLYKELKIRSLKDLEKAAKKGKIAELEGFGEKSQKSMLENIDFARSTTRMLLGHALPIAESIVKELKKSKAVKRCEAAGSLRRRRETVGDIDVLASSEDAEKVLEKFTKMDGVHDVLARGPTKATIRLKSGLQVDLRVLREKEYGSALLYFTGSKQHNVELRKLAIAKKMKLSEYGLKKGKKTVASKTEKEIYKKLGLRYIEPELREVSGEIGASKKGKLPKLVRYEDIRGDLQMHTTWSDGSASIEEMARAAKNLGREYICITDHTGRLAIAGGLSDSEIKNEAKETAKVNEKIDGITVLHGCEVNIWKDGKTDLKNSTLKDLDVVVAAVHSGFKMDKEKMTERILGAMENPNVDIIAHPTGRIINKRPGYEVDVEKLLEKSKETNTYLEINSHPNRLDLNDVNIRAAVERGCVLSMGTDSHSPEHLRFMELGVAQARRGWAEKKNILVTRTLKQLKKFIDLQSV